MTRFVRTAAWATGFAVVAFSSPAEARLPTRLVYVRARDESVARLVGKDSARG